jgi:hypothetical protein
MRQHGRWAGMLSSRRPHGARIFAGGWSVKLTGAFSARYPMTVRPGMMCSLIGAPICFFVVGGSSFVRWTHGCVRMIA